MRKAIIASMILAIGLFAAAGSAYALEAELLWGDQYPSNAFNPHKVSTRTRNIAADSQGNVYWAGYLYYYQETVQYFIRKYDSSGNLVWHRTYDTDNVSRNRVNDLIVKVDSLDNVYVSGGYRDPEGTDYYSYSAIVLKYSPDGEFLWDHVAALSEHTGFYMGSVFDLDAMDNAYLVTAVLTYGKGFGYVLDKMAPNGDVLLSDYRVGNRMWSSEYGPRDIVIAPSGTIYIPTVTSRIVMYDPSGAWSEMSPLLPYPDDYTVSIDVDQPGNIYAVFYDKYAVTDPFVAKFDPAGNLLWRTGILFSGSSEPHIKVDPDGNLIFTHGGTYDAYTNVLTSNQPGIVSKYDPSGNLLWTRQVTIGAYRDVPVLLVDRESNIYISGATDIGGRIKAYAMKYDPSGELLWETASSIGSYHDFPMGGALDPSGNVVAAGLSTAYVKPGWMFYFGGKYFVAKFGPSNSPPVADAGADQIIECGNDVTLDGSGSSDPDGDALSYTWSGSFGTVDGVTATVTLPLGTHTVTLTVDDGNGATSSDDVVITVEDTTPPVVTSATLSGTELQAGLYLSDVVFEMSATDSCSGVASVSYTLDGVQNIFTGGYATGTISTGGDHTIAYDATDNAGNTSEAESLAFSLFEANEGGLSDLVDYYLGQGLISSQMATSLTTQAAHGSYEAFINHIEAQSGKKIDPAVAQILIQAAQYIMGN